MIAVYLGIQWYSATAHSPGSNFKTKLSQVGVQSKGRQKSLPFCDYMSHILLQLLSYFYQRTVRSPNFIEIR